MTVAKLPGARERKRREAGKCEGRKSHAVHNPELVALAKRLHRHKPKGGASRLKRIEKRRLVSFAAIRRCDKTGVLVVGAAQAADYEVSTSMRRQRVKIKEIA